MKKKEKEKENLHSPKFRANREVAFQKCLHFTSQTKWQWNKKWYQTQTCKLWTTYQLLKKDQFWRKKHGFRTAFLTLTLGGIKRDYTEKVYIASYDGDC